MENEVILVVEDERTLLENNREYLEMKGYRTLAAATLGEARAILERQNVDLLLLDVNLPDGSGFDLASAVPPETAILYLTGRTAEEDVVHGLGRAHGRVDYLKKPFSYAELGARISALLNARTNARDKNTFIVFTKGPLVLDLLAQQGSLNGRELLLTPKEFSILRLLMENEGKVLAKEAIYETVWKQPMEGDGSALWMQVSRLKKKLEKKGGQTEITVVRGKGYTLNIGK